MIVRAKGITLLYHRQPIGRGRGVANDGLIVNQVHKSKSVDTGWVMKELGRTGRYNC